MKNCIYFVSESAQGAQGPLLRRGYGFQRDGSWRSVALPENAAGLVLDDAFLPDRRGLDAALRCLRAWDGLIVLDFERPCAAALTQLAAALAGKEVVVPASYAACPHSRILIGPWSGCGSFLQWLERLQTHYGAVALDGAPLRFRVQPGGRRALWRAPLPASGFPCHSAGCLHRRLADGSILFWDTLQTLTERSASAGVPVLLFQEDWNALASPQDGA